MKLIDLVGDHLREHGKDRLAEWHGAMLRDHGRRAIGVDDAEDPATDAYWGGREGRENFIYHLPPAAVAGKLETNSLLTTIK